ncbi:hypothetical protein [Amycolatopsis sp. lyj-346]|uniref:hypothetical protein n=1 Tax=Amycolatopsis sp. lyj-346 TaxID=2789289 RepID=UPI00397A4137
MNRIESAAQHLPPGSELVPLVPVEPLSCAVAVWRAVTRLATADRAYAEREFGRAIAQGHPDLGAIGFHPAAELIRHSVPSEGVSLMQLVNAVEAQL